MKPPKVQHTATNSPNPKSQFQSPRTLNPNFILNRYQQQVRFDQADTPAAWAAQEQGCELLHRVPKAGRLLFGGFGFRVEGFHKPYPKP